MKALSKWYEHASNKAEPTFWPICLYGVYVCEDLCIHQSSTRKSADIQAEYMGLGHPQGRYSAYA